MSVVRTKKSSKKPYVMLDTTALNDTRLSFRAKGLHTYLMSKPDGWQVYIDQLEKSSPLEGREAIRNAIGELQQAGYVKREKARGARGRLAGWSTTIYETPGLAEEAEGVDSTAESIGLTELPPTTGLPTSVPPTSVPPTSAKPPLVINDLRFTPLTVDPLSLSSRELPPSDPAPKKRKVTTKTHSVPADFAVTPAMLVWANEFANGVDLTVETELFRNHEFVKPHGLWEQTWRQWMIRAWKEQQPVHPPSLSRAQQRNQNNIASTFRLEELLNGRNRSAEVWDTDGSASSGLPHRIARLSTARLLDRPRGPAS